MLLPYDGASTLQVSRLRTDRTVSSTVPFLTGFFLDLRRNLVPYALSEPRMQQRQLGHGAIYARIFFQCGRNYYRDYLRKPS
jgi:hypothetical protein